VTRVIPIANDMDAAGMTRLRVEFEQLAHANEDIVLDLAKVGFLDSSGVGGIVYLFKRLRAAGRTLRLANVGGQPLQLLSHLQLTDQLAVSSGEA
jgi:anti-anti-sigma factor